jgi:hypothetical protein
LTTYRETTMPRGLRALGVGAVVLSMIGAPFAQIAPALAQGAKDDKPAKRPKPARGDEEPAGELLARAQAAVDAVDYDTAKKLVARAFAAGGMVPGELARAHRFAGEVAAAVGDEGSAREHFVRWILLDPRASMAPGVSPKISAAFEAARKDTEKLGPMTLVARVERSEGKAVVIVDAQDPVDLIARVQVRTGAGELSERGLRVELPAVDREVVHATVTALDKDGNELWKDELRAAPLIKPEKSDGSSRWIAIGALGGLAVVAGGLGGYFGSQVGTAEDDLAALHADSSNHTYDEAKDIEDRGKRNALLANLSFGVAGAAAAAAILTFVLVPGPVEVAGAPTAGGGSVTATIRW